MDLPIKTLLVIVVLIVVFVVMIFLITDWGGESNTLFQGVVEWFGELQTNPGSINPGDGSNVQPGDTTGNGPGQPNVEVKLIDVTNPPS